MASAIIPRKLCGWLLAPGGVPIVLMVGRQPASESLDQLEGAAPIPQPQALLCARASDTCGIRVALGISVAGIRLVGPQRAVGLREGERGG